VRRPGDGTSCATSACELMRPETGVYQAGRNERGGSDVEVAELRGRSLP
jgi:hypothetical protein